MFRIYSVIIIIILFPFLAHAQSFGIPRGTGLGGSGVSIVLFPEDTKPGAYSEFRVESTSVNVTVSNVMWYVDGVRLLSGPSETRFVYKVPLSTKPFLVRVELSTPSGGYYEAERTVYPASVTLLWEGNTYAPPFYKGRPMLSPEASLVVEAVPHLVENGVELQPKDLIYKWTVNRKTESGISGVGKNSATIPNSGYLRPIDVIVEVSSLSGITASERVVVNVGSPWVVFYENNPLLGIRYDRALDIHKLTKEEVTVVAEPYHFSIPKRNDPDITYEWTIDSSRQAESRNPSLTLRPQGTGNNGRSTISVAVRNTVKKLQEDVKSFVMEF